MRSTRTRYRLALGGAMATTVFLLLGSAALGIVGDGGPPDLLYVGAVAVGLVLAAVARFRAAGMARAVGTTAVLTLLAGLIAVAAGLEEDGSAADVLALSAMYAAMFAASAWLLRSAAAVPGSSRGARP